MTESERSEKEGLKTCVWFGDDGANKKQPSELEGGGVEGGEFYFGRNHTERK